MTTMKIDPTIYLPEALVLQVLEFLAPKAIVGLPLKRKKMVDPSELGQYYHSLARVHHRWKQLLDSWVLPTVCVEMDFERLSAAAFWVSDRQVPIGSIQCNEDAIARQTAIPFMFQCNTAELQHAKISIFGGGSWLLKHQRGLQGILAQQCPNLRSLHLEISPQALQVWNDNHCGWGKGYPGCMCSSHLFSHAAIETVKVSIRHKSPTTPNSNRPISIDPTFFTSLIQGWERLASLTLEHENNVHLTTSYEAKDDGRLELAIESASLKSLSVEKFTSWDGTTFDLDCPNLEELVCSVELATVQPPLLLNLPRGCNVAIVQPSMAVTAADLKFRKQQLVQRGSIGCSCS